MSLMAYLNSTRHGCETVRSIRKNHGPETVSIGEAGMSEISEVGNDAR